MSFWGEPLWLVLLFVGPCLLFVYCMCVNQYLHWLVEMSLVKNGAQMWWQQVSFPIVLGFACGGALVGIFPLQWVGISFLVLGNCDPERPFCTAFVCLVFDNTCRDNQSSIPSYSPPRVKERRFFFNTAWPLYSLDSEEKLVKMKLFWNSKTVFFLHMQLEKAGLMKYTFSEFWPWENKNISRKKLEVN